MDFIGQQICPSYCRKELFVPNLKKMGKTLQLLERRYKIYYVYVHKYIKFWKTPQNVFWGPMSSVLNFMVPGLDVDHGSHLNSSISL